MKQLLGISLLFLYLIALLRPISPYIDYLINKKHIVEELCINKDKPELHCEGKCYLHAELKKINTEKDGKQTTLPSIDIEKYPIGFILCKNHGEVAITFFSELEFDRYADATIEKPIEIPSPPPRLIL